MKLSRSTGFLLALLLVVGLLILGRSALRGDAAPRPARLTGPILLWHRWDEGQTAALLQAIANFEQAFPGVRVVVVRQPADELLSRYTDAVDNGFGPDLLLGPAEWLPQLVQAHAVDPFPPALAQELANGLFPGALRTGQDGDATYATPLALRIWALYYNRSLVETPPLTLDDLLLQAGQGLNVGVGTSFEAALWGLGTMGGALYDDAGRLLVDKEGFTSWFTWLKNAQTNESFVLSSNQEGLRRFFLEGKLAYLVDRSEAWTELTAGLPENALGVRPLPSGPGGPATPLLRAHALYLNPESSRGQRLISQELVRFLTAKEQQTLLMRRGGVIPVRRDVRINSRLNPEMYAFATQARTAIPWRNDPLLLWLLEDQGDIYAQVLDGIRTPAEAVDWLEAALQEQQAAEGE
ncbi:MAG: extracellular solute-binding protein [Caldilineae bacterium]|nr:MAG: extracellular solute-binding protein [Caldilineae bacterium]